MTVARWMWYGIGEVMRVHYAKVLRDILSAKDWTYAALARKLGITRAAVSSVLREDARSGMTIERYLDYAHAVGAKVYVEWEDEGDGRRRYRWEVTHD